MSATVASRHGIDSVVLEQRSRDYVLWRVRAGALEQGSCEVLREYGLGERQEPEATEPLLRRLRILPPVGRLILAMVVVLMS